MNTRKENYTQKILKNIHTQFNLNHCVNKVTLSNFNILYLNIDSLLNKLDDLELEIYNIAKANRNKIIHAIALTEIRLHDRITQYFNLPHFSAFH